MSITKLYAGVVGDPLNTSGPQLAASVNNLIDAHVSHLKALPTAANAQTDTVYNVVGFYAGTTKGGGQFIYDPAKSKALHNGGTVLAPEAILAWDGTQADLATLLNWTGSGSGCWVRLLDGFVTPEMFGAVGDKIADDTTPINSAINAAVGVVKLTSLYKTSGRHELPSNITIFADNTEFGFYSDNVLVVPIAGYGHSLLYATGKSGIRIKSIFFDTGDQSLFSTGARCMTFFECSDYAVTDCKARCAGAFTGSLGSNNFKVKNNEIVIHEPSGTARHDGIIDQWQGSNDFEVAHNTIRGDSTGKYGILVTGTGTDDSPAPCYNFNIHNNKTYDTRLIGIQVHGRNGGAYDFSIKSNTIDGVTEFHGLGALDCWSAQIVFNRIFRTARNGLQMGQEGGAVPGLFSSKNVIVDGNIFADCCTLEASGADGDCIVIHGSSENIKLGKNNIVYGPYHKYACRLGAETSLIYYNTEQFQAGTIGKAFNLSVNNRPASGTYTPTVTAVNNVAAGSSVLSSYSIEGDVCTVYTSIGVTPTVGAATTTLGISLPIASDLTAATADCVGALNSLFNNLNAGVNADITNNRANLQFTSTGTAAVRFYGSFSYRIK